MLGWPELVTTALDQGPSLSYPGPLQKACPVYRGIKHVVVHHPMVLFLSQSAPGLSSKFWHRCFTYLEPSNSLRDGEKCGGSVSGSFPSFSAAVSCLKMLYKHSKGRKLFSSVLKDFALGEDPELFFKRCPDGEFTDDYTLNCTVESWPNVLHSSGYGVGTRTLRKRSLRRSASSRLKKARTVTSRTTKGPLVPSESRVWFIRLASNLVGLWRALVAFPFF